MLGEFKKSLVGAGGPFSVSVPVWCVCRFSRLQVGGRFAVACGVEELSDSCIDSAVCSELLFPGDGMFVILEAALNRGKMVNRVEGFNLSHRYGYNNLVCCEPHGLIFVYSDS